MRTDMSFVPFLVPAQPWSTVLHTNIAQLLEPASDTRQLSVLASNIKKPLLVYNHGSQVFGILQKDHIMTAGSLLVLS